MPVELRPENHLPYMVYSQCRGQLITRGVDGTPIDISIPAVEIAMAWMGVKRRDRGKIGLKVLDLARHELKAIREEREKNQTGG